MTFSPSHARMSAPAAPDSQDLTVLPNETLTTIFEHLGNDSLVSLVRVCRRFQGIGERLLYCNIVIAESTHRDSDGYMSPQQTEGCCTAVLLRPYLASNTKKISIRWQHDSRHVQDDFELAPSVAPGLRYLLRSAHSLEMLELHLAGYRGSWHDLLDGYSFQLRCVALSGPVNAPVEWFLSTQPNIIHLNLGDHHLPLRLAAHDLPSLETFRGDARTAASILPGRPVHGLALSGQEPSVECLIAFAYTQLPIRRLDLGSLSITPRQLLTISKHLPAVESLRMRLALRHTLHFTFSGMMLLSALTQVLGAFHSLAHLDLSPTSVDGVRGIHNVVEEGQLCIVWSGVCPSLQRVKFPSGAEWRRTAGMGEWERTAMAQWL